MSFQVMKFRVHGHLRIYVTTAADYYKMLSYANGRNWRILNASVERDKTVYQCEQIQKKYFGPMEVDNEEEEAWKNKTRSG